MADPDGASAHRLPAPDTRQRTGRGAYAQAQDSRAVATVTDGASGRGASRAAAVDRVAGCGPRAGAGAASPPDRPWCHRHRGPGADQVSELPKITPSHLRRDAYVYVRQSTITQVREHTESLQRQYELVERAAALGWLAHQVLVIDHDLGRSGADASAREGFKGLVADVGLGKVGLLLSMRGDGLRLPRRPARTGTITWAPPTYPAVHDLLTNPVYAGAFVFGRTRTEKRIGPDGRVVERTRQVPRAEWEVCIPDHHPSFVGWERYEQIQQQLRGNWRAPRGHGGGPAREGTALLQGRLRCGRCGRMMQTGYSGANGNCPRYVCGRACQLYGTEHVCQSLGGRRLEQRVLEEVFAVLEPAALAATARALAEAESSHAQRLAAFELAVERARYEADRARRQFDQVEPENRLVGRTLEAAWESALAEVRRAEADLAAQRARRPTTLT